MFFIRKFFHQFFLYLITIIFVTSCNLTSNKYLSNNLKIHKVIYTEDGTRLRLVKTNNKGDLNLVFVPGGPGVDSEYFMGLINNLDIKGNAWLIDLPDNGNNIRFNVDYGKWPKYLHNAVKTLDNVILIGHSFGGILILSEPKLNDHVKAIIIINSSPSTHSKAALEDKEKYNLPDLSNEVSEYLKSPSNEAQKALVVASIEYSFTKHNREEGKKFLESLIYNHKALDWVLKGNMLEYDTKYIPTVSTLIIGSDSDYTVPFRIFINDERFRKDNIKIVEIKNSSHFVWVERPNETKTIINEFLNSLK